MPPKTILFLCTGNQARSQMAEATMRRLGGDRYEPVSAGSAPKDRVHPLAVEVMAERGVDISGVVPKSAASFLETPVDLVVTLCDSARQACPVFPGAPEGIHWDLEDPAAAGGTREERLAAFRLARDEIERRIERLLAEDTGHTHDHGGTA
ncbi:MAG: arsenate reductase ArsC [Candidatus Krumholzibacteriota bacterium]|nr:arsenate reductase ArsC [Candidatus Krumholzibacteriota bacterium]